MQTQISIIIPTHNRASMLCQMIQSIGQMKGVAPEIIVVDDNSEDNTYNQVTALKNKGMNISYFHNNTNLGCGRSRQIGYNNSHGEYVVFADDDDYYTDQYFYKRAISYLNKNLSSVFYAANVVINYTSIQESHKRIIPYSGRYSGFLYLKDYLHRDGKPQSTFPTVFRKSMLDKVGFSQMQMMNDGAIYMKALLMGDCYIEKNCIGVYRVHGSNITNCLSSDFMIENLNETLSVYRLSQHSENKLPLCWLQDEYYNKCKYFYVYSPYTFLDLWKLSKWGGGGKQLYINRFVV